MHFSLPPISYWVRVGLVNLTAGFYTQYDLGEVEVTRSQSIPVGTELSEPVQSIHNHPLPVTSDG